MAVAVCCGPGHAWYAGCPQPSRVGTSLCRSAAQNLLAGRGSRITGLWDQISQSLRSCLHCGFLLWLHCLCGSADRPGRQRGGNG